MADLDSLLVDLEESIEHRGSASDRAGYNTDNKVNYCGKDLQGGSSENPRSDIRQLT